MRDRRFDKNRVMGIFMVIVGIVLIIFAFYYYLASLDRMERRRLEIEEQKKILVEELEHKSESETEVETAEPEVEEPNKAMNIPGAIGFLEIEKLEVLLPIFPNATQKSLKNGVGVVETTDVPSGDYNTVSVLAGHRGGYNAKQTFFKINTLENGDLIKVTNDEGELVYSVTGSEVIEPTDWSKFVREDDKSKLILMTCHPYPVNNKRLLVYAELVEE